MKIRPRKSNVIRRFTMVYSRNKRCDSTIKHVLIEENAANEILTLTWTRPDFGFSAAALYSVQIDVQGGDFSNPQIISVGGSLDKTFTVEELNAKLLSLSMTPNEEGVASFRIKATLSEYQEIYSNTVNLSVTPYSSLLDLSLLFKYNSII